MYVCENYYIVISSHASEFCKKDDNGKIYSIKAK